MTLAQQIAVSAHREAMVCPVCATEYTRYKSDARRGFRITCSSKCGQIRRASAIVVAFPGRH